MCIKVGLNNFSAFLGGGHSLTSLAKSSRAGAEKDGAKGAKNKYVNLKILHLGLGASVNRGCGLGPRFLFCNSDKCCASHYCPTLNMGL